MVTIKSIKRNNQQLSALVERQLLFETRFKFSFIQNLITPFLQMLVIFFIFGVIYAVDDQYVFGYWTSSNFTLFLLIGFSIQYINPLIDKFQRGLQNEKYWKTLQALLIAPLNRFVIIFGIAFAHLIVYSLPIVFIMVLAFIVSPIPIYIFFLVLLVYFSIILTFGAIGLLLGAFVISNENVSSTASLFMKILFWLSCVTYPLFIFPEFVRFFILLNPLYYFFDLLRLTWLLGVDPEFALSFITPTHLIVVISFTVLTPIICTYLFDKTFKKYGIKGY